MQRSVFYMKLKCPEDDTDPTKIFLLAFSRYSIALVHTSLTIISKCLFSGIICLFFWRNNMVFASYCDPPSAPMASTVLASNFSPGRVLDGCINSYYSSEDTDTLPWFQASIDGNCSVAEVRIRNIHIETCTLQVQTSWITWNEKILLMNPN